jgi:ABC-type sugar transport system substrate-binding protein
MPNVIKLGTRNRIIFQAIKFGMIAAVFAVSVSLMSEAKSDEAGDAVMFAKKVVDAGRLSTMSRSPLDEGGVTWTGAASSPPPVEGVTVAIMPCPMAFLVCKFLFDKANDAATAMGWEAFPIDNKGEPATAQKAVDVAINRGAKCVLTLASPSRDISAQIARGKEKGVAFVTGFSDDPREFGSDVGYGLDYGAAGALLGAHVIANGGGKIIVFNAPQLPQLTVRTDGFVDYIEKHGGGSAEVIHVEEFSLVQGAQGLVTKTQALLTRYPKGSFTWVIGPYDEVLRPVLATAAQRDRTEIKGVSFDGEDVAYNSLRTGGQQVATISWGLEWVSWAGIDECNRALNNAEVGVNTDFPIQLTDSSNVPPEGQKYDPGYDFKGHYKGMWDAARK